jgi:hypothetical protein
MVVAGPVDNHAIFGSAIWYYLRFSQSTVYYQYNKMNHSLKHSEIFHDSYSLNPYCPNIRTYFFVIASSFLRCCGNIMYTHAPPHIVQGTLLPFI